MNEILTYKLNNGREVLARDSKEYGINPITYANETQARRKAAELGEGWTMIGFRPYYVARKDARDQ